jgi:putative ATPase
VAEVVTYRDDESRSSFTAGATIFCSDVCHRWSKAQSDSILPSIEQGIIRFVGSTTENPMIAMPPAIVSRCRLFHFEPLTRKEVEQAILNAVRDGERGYGREAVTIDEDALAHIAQVANGDVRAALNALELAVLTTPVDASGDIHVTLAVAEQSIQKRVLRMDESMLYDMLSAFCKSLRAPTAMPRWPGSAA